MNQSIITKYRADFDEYFISKDISLSISKKFLSSFNHHIKENPKSFKEFWEFILSNKHLPIESTLSNLNILMNKKSEGYKTFSFIIDWSHSYLGPAELMCLLLVDESYSGGKKYPDILFRNSDRKIEVKSYADNFRLTESTSFFTDLGTIIQALVQGGFLNSLTDIKNSDLIKGLSHFSKSFTCPRGFIELNGKIWRLEYKSDDIILFKASPETSDSVVNYSIVRNSLRNWLGRGLLSIKLAEIIDPMRVTRITPKEINEYIGDLLGTDEKIPIPLEQYFTLSGIESMIIYDKKDKEEPFRLYGYKDLSNFTLDRIGQAKVSYKKLKTKSSK